MSGYIETQKAIIDLLRSDAVLVSKVNKIANYIPDNTAAPVVRVKLSTSNSWRTHSRLGYEYYFDIIVTSNKESSKEMGLIMQDINRLLGDNTSLCISGQDLVACYYEGETPFEEVINDVFYRNVVYSIRCQMTSKTERI